MTQYKVRNWVKCFISLLHPMQFVKTELTPRNCDASKTKAVYCCSL